MQIFGGSLGNHRPNEIFSDGSNLRIAVVAGKWNSPYSEMIIDGAVSALLEQRVKESNISIVRVPGSYEIPVVCKKVLSSGSFDAVLALGILVEGETDHYRLIADNVSRLLSDLSVQYSIPISLGILTAKNEQQIIDRLGGAKGHIGRDAALAAVETALIINSEIF